MIVSSFPNSTPSYAPFLLPNQNLSIKHAALDIALAAFPRVSGHNTPLLGSVYMEHSALLSAVVAPRAWYFFVFEAVLHGGICLKQRLMRRCLLNRVLCLVRVLNRVQISSSCLDRMLVLEDVDLGDLLERLVTGSDLWNLNLVARIVDCDVSRDSSGA